MRVSRDAVILESGIIVLNINACERLEMIQMGVQTKLSFSRSALVAILECFIKGLQ